MLVYGDHQESVDPRARLLALEEQRRALTTMPAGLARHGALTSLFLGLAGVTQGIADADFAGAGVDRVRPEETALLLQLIGVAAALIRSWDSGLADDFDVAPITARADLPDKVGIRLPEGYAFYALYPESYALAARQLKLTAKPRVIGLRSIGTGLACMVAAALDAPPPITLRPGGHPFARTLAIDDALAADLLTGDPHFVIVDEGPGLSGSSFGAVIDWLEEHGVPLERIAALPGHDGPLGGQASPQHRARWDVLQRPVATSDALLDGRLESWIAALVGPLSAPLEDISGGAWRSHVFAAETQWPPVNPTWERRKYLARTASAIWQVRFAGLGAIGEGKLGIARHLHAAGFGPEVADLAHGWLVLRWHEDAQPTSPTNDELSAYLKCRAALPSPIQGASLCDLAAMARHNLPHLLSGWSPDVSTLEKLVRLACIDGRMARPEWLRLTEGRLIKADALDHHQAHDLVGAQDLAWDVAGAALELDLSPEEVEALTLATNSDPALTAFYLRAYGAFRIGALRLSAQMLPNWPAEAARNVASADVLEQRLIVRL